MSNFDEALERFHLGDLEYGGGLANHGPMGAEALERLGHQALMPAFLGLYAPRLPPAEPGRGLDPGEEERALGAFSRAADWVATFEARLETGDWRKVVAREVPKRWPGLFAGAGHGLLRTAHAVRALEQEDSALRRRELARGLAYWSARYQRLPGRPGIGEQSWTGILGEARSGERRDPFAWPLVGEPGARVGLFFEAIARLDRFPAFADAIERLARPRASDFSAFTSALARLACGLYLEHPESRIAYVHLLTIPSAIRLLAPYVTEAEACEGAMHAFQAMMAMHSMFGGGQGEPEPDPEVERAAGDWNEIRYHAACSLEEHAIKMAEACWREDRIASDPVFRRAAADAALKIDARGRAPGC